MDDGQLFSELYPVLRRVAAACTASHLDPDDLVQEALARTLRRTSLSDLDEPLAYLISSIHNISRNERREDFRHKTRLMERVPDTQYSSEPDIVTTPPILEGLPKLTRVLLVLVDVEGYTSKEAARMTGSSHVAVRARLSRAHRALAASLQPPNHQNGEGP